MKSQLMRPSSPLYVPRPYFTKSEISNPKFANPLIG
jgi:hypothetical protein